MSTYYCLVAGLPDISLDDGKLSYSIADFKSELYPELSVQDRKLIDLFYLKFDNADLLELLKNKDAVTEGRGNFSAEELLQLIDTVRDGDVPDKNFLLIWWILLLNILYFRKKNCIALKIY